MKLQRILLVFCLLAYTYTIFGLQTPPDRPRIWVVSDYSPSTDKDDQVVMNVLLLWANEFRIEGLAPGSHKRNIATAGLNLFKKQHIAGYKKDYPNLSKCYSNFPTPAELEAVTYKSSTSDGKGYRVINNLNDFPSIKAMIEAARRGSASDPLYVLLWGPQGEGATAADWLLRNEPATLKKMVFVAHASRPANKYNCQQDATACKKLHDWASQGKLEFVECGDSGQKGIHKHTGGNKLSASVQKVSFWINHKWNGGNPDWSDGASFVCLLPQFGVNFKSLKSNGADNTGYLTNVYKNNRNAMYKLIEERADKAINGGCNVAQFTIAASAGQGGKITPNGNVKVNKGDDKTFTITANAGYEIADVKVNGSSIGAQASYTFTNVSGDQSISATFKEIIVNTYTITATAGANGKITPSGAVTVKEGANQTFAIQANPGYEVADVVVNGSSVGAQTSYTFTNVTSDQSISATFKVSPIVNYTITATAGANGSITPSGAVTVKEGNNQKFTISAAAGYKVKDVLVDNASVGAVSSYTFSNVKADHSISATFEKLPDGPIVVTQVISDCNQAKKARNIIFFTVSAKHNKVKSSQGKVVKDGNGKYRIRHIGVKFGSVVNYKITVSQGKKVVATKTVKVNTTTSCNPTTKEYTITATAGANGTITPSGNVKVKEGANQSFNIKAAAGYKVDDVVVDNASVGAVGTYTFTNVTQNHSIKATFAKSGTTTDCAGVPGGTAYIDDCGDCVGGTTGKEPCTPGGFDFIDYSAYTVGASHDGNQHDKDDILAAPMMIALLGQTGLADRFVHMDYSNHLGSNNAGQAQKMAASVNGACEKWGLPKNVTFDCQKNLNGAVNSIKNAINSATPSKRFYYACGGPMEVPWRGINASNKANRSNTTAISHSKWNNNHSDTPQLKHKWTDIQKTGVKTTKIKDQNGTAFNVAEKNWSWLKGKGGKYAWLFSRNFKSSFDASDAGMTWYIITGRGDQNAGMTQIKEVFNGVVVKPKDCAGVPGGTAYIDDCGECVGGTTGKEPCVVGEKDCAGVVGGTAYIDDCGECVGGTTGKEPCVVPPKDCAGVPGGTAYIDDCGECVGGTTGKEPCVIGNCTDVTLAAITDFPNFNVKGFVPGYIDNKRQALAVNAKQHKDKWAAAIATFNGESATYNITMTSLLETDGECSYKIKVDGQLVGEYQNIPTKKDYTPYTQTFEGVQVSKGAKIQVEFNTHTNKTVPEGNGWAYARGRWTKVEFVCAGTIDCSANVDPIVTLSAPATVKEGFPIALTASVTDENMGIVEFYRGTTKVGTATSAPYAVTVTAGAPGVESFYAKAIDKCDGEGMSATVDVTVTEGGNQNCDIYTEIAGLVVMEAENTKSPLGKWKKVSSLNGYSGTGHIEFTGNKPSGGAANSPLTYKFKITESGDYRMLLRAHKRLAGSASDHCNDAYVKVTGNYTSGTGGAPLSLLTKNTKFFGGSATGWGWAQKLDANHNKHLAIYKFKAGETYTMTISGRSQRFNIDRILFFKTSIPIATAQAADKETKDCRKSQFEVESLANNFEVYPNPASHTVNLDVTGITDVKIFNMQGKLVYSKVLNSSTIITSSELGGSGLYFIKANNESHKLIVE